MNSDRECGEWAGFFLRSGRPSFSFSLSLHPVRLMQTEFFSPSSFRRQTSYLYGSIPQGPWPSFCDPVEICWLLGGDQASPAIYFSAATRGHGWLQSKAERADNPFGSAEYSICGIRLKGIDPWQSLVVIMFLAIVEGTVKHLPGGRALYPSPVCRSRACLPTQFVGLSTMKLRTIPTKRNEWTNGTEEILIPTTKSVSVKRALTFPQQKEILKQVSNL